jgi:predicted MPP superfamily phosphohydrolase
MPAVTLLFTLAALAAGGVGALVVVWLSGRDGGHVMSPGWTATLTGLAAAGAVGGLAAFPLGVVGMRFFGIIHLAYLGVTIAVPLVGVALAVRSLLGPLPRVWALAGAALVLPAPVGWYATHVEPYRLTVDRQRVPIAADRAGDDAITVGVLSDLQTDRVSSHEHDAVDRLMAEDPDLILIAGDLFQGSLEQFADQEDELRSLLSELHAPHGVYFVRGDVDAYDFADRALADSEAVILDDEIVEVEVGDRRLRIGGNRLGYATDSAVAMQRALSGGPNDGTLRILLSHRPDAALGLDAGARVDLTVAGHTHGGQVVVPGFGPLMTMSEVSRDAARGGLHRVHGNLTYVSTGVGMERRQAPQVRLFARPSVGVLELVDA